MPIKPSRNLKWKHTGDWKLRYWSADSKTKEMLSGPYTTPGGFADFDACVKEAIRKLAGGYVAIGRIPVFVAIDPNGNEHSITKEHLKKATSK